MEDIDLTLDRTFSDRSRWQWSNDFRLITHPNRTGLGDILQVFLENNNRIKSLQEIIEPWHREEDDFDRGSFFGFKLRDPYASEGGLHCDRCGIQLRPWDWNEEWGYTSCVCMKCNHEISDSVADDKFKKELFEPSGEIRNIRL